MKKRPKGRRYRNLVLPKGSRTIWVEKVVSGRRHRFNTKTANWDQAVRVRDLWETKIGVGLPILEPAPRLRDFAARYLEEDTDNLAPTTQQDRRLQLAPEGRIIGRLGDRRLDAITPAMLREWYGEMTRDRSSSTARNHVNALAAVFQYAKELGLVAGSPVPALREMVARRNRTQRGRRDAEANLNPIRDPEAIDRLLEEARVEGSRALVYALLCLDAGLRAGEAEGLTWGSIVWGTGEDDRSRHLLITRSRSRNVEVGFTKSGRARRVALSRRLRAALLALRRERWEPGPEGLVIEGLHRSNFHRREWRRILKRAGIGHVRPKDLRDTYGSWLVTCGVPLQYVAQQLGHASTAVTERHYARWLPSADGDDYTDPMAREPGEVPADFLARLPRSKSPQSLPKTGVPQPAAVGPSARNPGAGDGGRTRDPRLGKPMLYH